MQYTDSPYVSVHCRSKAQYMGRKLVTAMKDKLGKQLFEVVIQASANGEIVARETIKVGNPLLTLSRDSCPAMGCTCKAQLPSCSRTIICACTMYVC